MLPIYNAFDTLERPVRAALPVMQWTDTESVFTGGRMAEVRYKIEWGRVLPIKLNSN